MLPAHAGEVAAAGLRVGEAGPPTALTGAVLGVGGALGLPLAGLVAEHFDFSALFWIMAVGGVVALVGVWLAVPEAPTRTGGRLDPGRGPARRRADRAAAAPVAGADVGLGLARGDRPAGALGPAVRGLRVVAEAFRGPAGGPGDAEPAADRDDEHRITLLRLRAVRLDDRHRHLR